MGNNRLIILEHTGTYMLNISYGHLIPMVANNAEVTNYEKVVA